PSERHLLALRVSPQPFECLRRTDTRLETGRQHRPEVRTRPASLEHGGVGQPAEQLRLRDEQLRQEIAAGAEPHESVQQLWTGREQLDVARARTRGGEKALEMIERLVRIGTLP